MSMLDVVFNWIATITGLGSVVLAIIGASVVRDKIETANPNWKPHWANSIIPSIGFLFIHLAIWWMLPTWWTAYYQKTGFLLFQILAVFGIYSMTLSSSPAKIVGKTLVWISVFFLALNIYIVRMDFIKKNSEGVGGMVKGMIQYKTDFPAQLRGNSDAEYLYGMLVNNATPDKKKDAFVAFVTCIMESNGGHQFDENGEPLPGKNPDGTLNGAIGICQIKPEFHAKVAEQLSQKTGLNYNLETLEGNSRMALHLVMTDPNWRNLWALSDEAELMVSSGQLNFDLSKPAVEAQLAKKEVGPEPQATQVIRTSLISTRSGEISCEDVILEAPLKWSDWYDTTGGKSYLSTTGPIWIQDHEGRKIPLDNHSKFELAWTSEVQIVARSNSFDGKPNKTPSNVIITICR